VTSVDLQIPDLQPSVFHHPVDSEQKKMVEENTTPKFGFAAELLRAGPLTK
jgi:hypothetical protein